MSLTTPNHLTKKLLSKLLKRVYIMLYRYNLTRLISIETLEKFKQELTILL